MDCCLKTACKVLYVCIHAKIIHSTSYVLMSSQMHMSENGDLKFCIVLPSLHIHTCTSSHFIVTTCTSMMQLSALKQQVRTKKYTLGYTSGHNYQFTFLAFILGPV